MSNPQPTLYEGSRMTMGEAMSLTAESLRMYGSRYRRWSVAYSGGKDSSALVTATVHLIERGVVPRPERLTVLYGDTRMELTPLYLAAQGLMADLSNRDWIDCRVVCAPLDQRFFVYMLGRGVPPPNNNTLRWCTAQIKVEPMAAELKRLAGESPEKVLMLIGVRIGESAVRDGRIAIACSRNGAECGQGWYQRDLPDAVCDKLSPLLHWRTCQVWDWLQGMGSSDCDADHGFPTGLIAAAYGDGGDGSVAETNARTGCIGCPLASDDVALRGVVARPEWAYLAPLMGLRPIYRQLREPANRLRMPGGETRKDGTLIGSQNRMGPLTLETRLWALGQILAIQAECNQEARRTGRPEIDLLNTEEESRIRELIAAGTWPNRWTGDEPVADLPYVAVGTDGSRQLLLDGIVQLEAPSPAPSEGRAEA